MESCTFLCGDGDIQKRLDVYLTDKLEDISRSGIQKWIGDGLVLVNGKKAKSNYKLRKADKISMAVKEPETLNIEAENIPLDILYEDGDLIVVNKPKGMVVHPAAGHYSQTLVNALMYHCGGSLSGINGVMRPGIVHRIDKDTSGIIVAAKNDFTHAGLSKQLAEHTMTRKYYAVVCNGFKENAGTVDKNIIRHPMDRKKMTVIKQGGRKAVTHYKVLERLGKYMLIEARLETGRTHQIRVHMASIGHPVLGDSVYGSGRPEFKLQGQALHAGALGFVHPRTGEYMEFEAEPPQYFRELLEKLRHLIYYY